MHMATTKLIKIKEQYIINMNEIIKNYYYDANTGYVSANKLYQKMKDDKYNVTRKQIKELYDSRSKQIKKLFRKQKYIH